MRFQSRNGFVDLPLQYLKGSGIRFFERILLFKQPCIPQGKLLKNLGRMGQLGLLDLTRLFGTADSLLHFIPSTAG